MTVAVNGQTIGVGDARAVVCRSCGSLVGGRVGRAGGADDAVTVESRCTLAHETTDCVDTHGVGVARRDSALVHVHTLTTATANFFVAADAVAVIRASRVGARRKVGANVRQRTLINVGTANSAVALVANITLAPIRPLARWHVNARGVDATAVGARRTRSTALEAPVVGSRVRCVCRYAVRTTTACRRTVMSA